MSVRQFSKKWFQFYKKYQENEDIHGEVSVISKKADRGTACLHSTKLRLRIFENHLNHVVLVFIDEYRYARVSVIFQFFCNYFVLINKISHHQHNG